MKKITFALSFFMAVSVTLHAASATPDSKKTETWIGQREEAVISLLKSSNKKFKFDGGGIHGGTAQIVYNAANPKNPVPVYFWVSPVSASVSTITGVMKIPTLKSNEMFGYDCSPAGASAIAILKKNAKLARLPAIKAWNVDINTGKFKEIPAKGIICMNVPVTF